MGKSKKAFNLTVDRRPISCIQLAIAPIQIIFAHIPAVVGILGKKWQELILALISVLIFIIAYVVVSIYPFGISPDESLSRSWRFLCNAIYDFRTELILTLVAYLVARVIQHVNDWRDYQVTWAEANLDRLSNKDFPCLIVGRGGSGKSTLAGLLEYDFYRRLVIRPAGFVDMGAGENLLARTPKEIGDAVGRYEVSWRPRAMEVGHRAAAFDLPGQLLGDWKEAIASLKGCKRVAIINVLTFGYNAEIKKYGEIEEIHSEPKEFHVKEFHKQGNNEEGTLPNHSRYFNHIFVKELEGFQCITNAIKKTWPKGGAAPKLVLINLVTMAKHWVDPDNRLQSVDARVEDHYRALFRAEIESLQGHLGDHFAMAFLPASLQWGDMRHECFTSADATHSAEIECSINEGNDREKLHENKHKMLLFKALQRVTLKDFNNGLASCDESERLDYESRAKYVVQTKKHLADMSIQTLRIIRRELYRKKSNWATLANKIKRTDGKEVDWSLSVPKNEHERGM